VSDALLLPYRDAEPQWAELWERSRPSPFSSPPFARALARRMDVRVLALAESGAWEAAALVCPRPIGPLQRAPAPMLAYYFEPLLAAPEREGHVVERRSPLTRLLAELGRRFPLVSLQTSPAVTDCRAFAWTGFACTPLYTYATASPTADAFSKTVRKRVRQFGDRYTIEPAPAGSAQVADLALAAYRRDGRSPPLPPAEMQTLWSELEAGGLVRALIARSPEGAVEGAQILLDDGRTLSTWIGGSVPGPAMTLLTAAVIEQAARSGRMVDLLGANTPPVAAFKRSFGVPLQTFYRAVRVPPLAASLHALRPLV
jgi:hypothetical protein